MNFENYSDRCRGFIQSAQGVALNMQHQRLASEHLLKILLDDDQGMAATLITAAGGDVKYLTQAIAEELAKLPKISGDVAGQLHLDASFAKILAESENLAKKTGDSFVTAEYMLLAMTMIKGTAAAKRMKDANIKPQNLNIAINEMRKGRVANSATAENKYDALKKYTHDLTKAASDGKLDPVIGRDEEIRRIIQILSRRTKNNPVLIGEPGVGKTAIIEGLALRIINGDVPEAIKGKKLLSLDLASMVAGAKFRGEFEERLKAVLEEISSSNGEIICFIDELHSLVGAGAAEGSMDASNMLKPALARGELHCVGATTLDEYSKYIEKDAAFARRFQSLMVNEPTVADTISILRGLKEKYELHHGVGIKDNALVAAASLSNRYISNRFLPDKAIDLMDEAASRLRMEVDSKPENIDELDRRIMQLKIEREALKKEKDRASKDRLQKLMTELSSLEEESSILTAKWVAEKDKLQGAQNIKESLENARLELTKAKRNGEFERAGELSYGIIPKLEQSLAATIENESNSNNNNNNNNDNDDKILKEIVTDNDIAAVVSRWTGIPVDKMLAGERQKLLQMENKLGERVIGQNDAIAAISNAVRRSRAGLQALGRPIGSFLCLGPTGVGKTELSKALAEFLFDDDQAILRIDMSEYMEKHAVSRLIGAPPGYVGYDQGGALTEAVRRKPYQVILFDEMEKAHPDIFNILLQVLDDGRLTDGQGRLVDFSNVLILMTSNLGAEFMVNQEAGDDVELIRPQIMDVVRANFRPEFLNRIDETLLFHRLSRENIGNIVHIQIAQLQNLLEDRKIKLNLDAAAINWLGDAGYDPIYGARPLRRIIERNLQNPLANKILAGDIADGDIVNINMDKDGIIINLK